MSLMSLEERSRLFLQHQRSLRSFVRAMIKDAEDADDLVQEVGVRVLSKDVPGVAAPDFPAWCRGVARNLVLHYWRSRQRRRETTSERYADIVARAYDEADADADAWSERRGALMTCLEQLGPPARELLVSRYVEHLTSDVIAARTNRSAVSVRKALMRIRESLLRCIQIRLGAGEGRATS